MWRVENSLAGNNELPKDIQRAVSTLKEYLHKQNPHLAPWFQPHKGLIAARAPGRLDVMGGIADYSGSLVLQLPLEESAVVLFQGLSIPEIKLVSRTEDNESLLRFSAPISDFIDKTTGRPNSLAKMRRYFSNISAEQQWAGYVAGVLSVLMNEYDVMIENGFIIYIDSSVPVGKGISSSAAIEVASMSALALNMGLEIDPERLAVLCQRVENQVVGAPCGLMDQMTSSAGTKDQLLTMLCQPDKVGPPTPLPRELTVMGIDSGIRHAVSGNDYTSVRVAAFMGYRLILDLAGIAPADVLAKQINDNRWQGYLANLSVSEFNQDFYTDLPDVLSGSEFLKTYDATTDTVTEIDPAKNYAIRSCTAHPVHEHYRARVFSQLARTLASTGWQTEPARLMGECMFQSHTGYSACGLASDGTDDIVNRLRQAGIGNGIYGARITGGGSGGTVAVLTHVDAEDTVSSIAADYASDTGIGGQVFCGSSEGAFSCELQPLT
ncbi:MAG: hypothetical protein KTR32_25855 [Granulosicoccus sp.]|nr:hypothetical protein [Granulosicoccus sp.]